MPVRIYHVRGGCQGCCGLAVLLGLAWAKSLLVARFVAGRVV